MSPGHIVCLYAEPLRPALRFLPFPATFPRPPPAKPDPAPPENPTATPTTHGVNVKLPLETNIPLDVLNTKVGKYLELHFTVVDCLRKEGIHRIWQLLLHTEAQLLKLKGFGEKSLAKVSNALYARNLEVGALTMYWKIWNWSMRVDTENILDLFHAVDPDMYPIAPETRPIVDTWLTEHGLHANMTIDELFVYVPTERPPLTEEQVAFLGQWPRDVFTAADELAWWHMHVSNTVRNRVFNIAVLLPHLRSDDVHKDVIARIRARIEAEVGPLPLALSSDELRNFFR